MAAMPLSERVVKELEAELAAEDEQLRKLEQEKARLEAQMTEAQERVRAMRSLLGRGRMVPSAVEAAEKLVDDGGGATEGLRAAIRAVLASAPQGLKPRQVTEGLKKRGFRPTGQMDVGIRVSSEVWRMHKAGKLGKTRDGRYLLLKEAADQQ